MSDAKQLTVVGADALPSPKTTTRALPCSGVASAGSRARSPVSSHFGRTSAGSPASRIPA